MRHSWSKKKASLSLLAFLLALLVMAVSGAYAGDVITVTAVGDIMMGTDWPKDLLPPDDGEGIFDAVKEHLRGSDIVFGNLEGPLMDGGEPAKCKEPSENCYEFRTPTRFVRHLREAGFNAMNIANNHAFDFELEGVQSTIGTLWGAGIQPVGGSQMALFSVEDTRVGVIGFSYTSSLYSHSILSLKRAASLVRILKSYCHILIVSVHGGAEGKEAQHVRDEKEEYLGEERGNAVAFARAVIDAGADLVIGHGPHVLRALDAYKGRLIAYSLGNFLTYERFNISGPSGLSVILRVTLDRKTREFVGGEVLPVRVLGGGLPEPDPEGKAIEILRGLTEEDFSAPAVRVSEEGELSIINATGILREPPEDGEH
jgi:poly-gamma-glutamate capsule biosynthesis protein CapA/YwtB (metallophosphatase superfamily)